MVSAEGGGEHRRPTFLYMQGTISFSALNFGICPQGLLGAGKAQFSAMYHAGTQFPPGILGTFWGPENPLAPFSGGANSHSPSNLPPWLRGSN